MQPLLTSSSVAENDLELLVVLLPSPKYGILGMKPYIPTEFKGIERQTTVNLS